MFSVAFRGDKDPLHQRFISWQIISRLPMQKIIDCIRLSGLSKMIESSPSQHSFELEFQRAINMTFKKTTVGLTNFLQFQEDIDVEMLLSDIGIFNGWCGELAIIIHSLIKRNSHPVILLYIIASILGEQVLPITIWYNQGIKIPSTNSCTRFFAVLFGLWFSCSLISDSSQFGKVVHRLYQDDSWLSFGFTESPCDWSKEIYSMENWKREFLNTSR